MIRYKQSPTGLPLSYPHIRHTPVSPLSPLRSVFEARSPSSVAYLNECEDYGSEGSVGSGIRGLLVETEKA